MRALLLLVIGLCALALGCHALLPFEPGGGRAGDGGGDAARDLLAWERAPAIDAASRDAAVDAPAPAGDVLGPADAQRPLEAKPEPDGTKPKPDLMVDQGSAPGPITLVNHVPITSWTSTQYDNKSAGLLVVLVAVAGAKEAQVAFGGQSLTKVSWSSSSSISTGVFERSNPPFGLQLLEVTVDKSQSGYGVATSWNGATTLSCKGNVGSSNQLSFSTSSKPGEVLAAIGAWAGMSTFDKPNELLNEAGFGVSAVATQQVSSSFGSLSVGWTMGASSDWSVSGALLSPP